MAARVTPRTEEFVGPANARRIRAWQDGRREGLRPAPTGDAELDRWLRELFTPQAARPPRLPTRSRWTCAGRWKRYGTMADYTDRAIAWRLTNAADEPLVGGSVRATLASRKEPGRRLFEREGYPTIWALSPVVLAETEPGLYSGRLIPNDEIEEGSVYRLRVQGIAGRALHPVIRMPDRDVTADTFDATVVDMEEA